MQPCKHVLLAMVLLLICSHAKADHIIGGELSYECTGPGVYSFTMKLYRDCLATGAGFDAPGNFAVFDENNQLVQTIQSSIVAINPINTSVASPCMVIPPNVCVEKGIYTFTVNVPNTSQGYTVVYQRCCRSGTIQNLSDPASQGLTIAAEIPPYDEVGCNSSPSFNNFPPPVLCAMENLEFDHSATDADGDSLAYSLCAPFQGGTPFNPLPLPPSPPPYAEVIWNFPANPLNPLPANPQLSIDPVTGLLTGVPTQLGRYVFGVCVEEWRDGQLLSVNRRDFQFNVAPCEPPSAAIIDSPDVEALCAGLTVDFSSSSDPSNVLEWNFGDPDNPNNFSSQYFPSHTFSDTGVYVVTLVTNPGFFCSDTATINVQIYYAAQITAMLEGFDCIDGEQLFNFTSTGSPENGEIEWNFGPNANLTVAPGESVSGISFNQSGWQEVSATISNNNCTATDVIEVPVPPDIEVSIEPQTEFCTGLTYQFASESSFADALLWDFGIEGDGGVSTQTNPIFTFPGEGSYTVSLTASNVGACPVSVSEEFHIAETIDVDLPDQETQCYEEHLFSFAASGNFTADATLSWQFENGLPATASGTQVDEVIFLEPGNHEVLLQVEDRGCTRTLSSTVRVHVNPMADFEASVRRGCMPLTVEFLNKSVSQSGNVAYEWDLGDGNGPRPWVNSHVFNQPGIYTLSLRMTNLDGCMESSEMVKQAYIEVLPTPQAGFVIEPNTVSSFDPQIEIRNLSSVDNACLYLFDDQEFSACDFVHTLRRVEPQVITQIVSNGDGCTAELRQRISVSDHLMYVPNAFSPNGDGVNERFKAETTGIVSYDLYIYDRWGREIYLEKDAQLGWDGGVMGSAYFAQAGLYQYVIIATDYDSVNHRYVGSVSLIR